MDAARSAYITRGRKKEKKKKEMYNARPEICRLLFFGFHEFGLHLWVIYDSIRVDSV
jgi:hypothetical protein